MKHKYMIAATLAFLSSAAIASEPTVKLSADCAGGSYDIANNDIELYNLNMDSFRSSARKNCFIVTEVPAKNGFRVKASGFQAEGLAVNVRGSASLAVKHRFANQRGQVSRDVVRENGGEDIPLFAADRVSNSSDGSCGKGATILTQIRVQTSGAGFSLDQAVLTYNYSSC